MKLGTLVRNYMVSCGRYDTEPEPEPTNPELVGPLWAGYCPGNCSSTVCLPCPANNQRLSTNT
jgi:hypothetical protein